MHGLLDCSISWFMHANKYFLSYLELIAYLICLHLWDMMFGWAITEEIGFQETKMIIAPNIGTTISIIS